MANQKEPGESNIAVVVRIKPQLDKSNKDTENYCVRANELSGKDIVVKTGASESFYKTYTFDKVLGPEATQETVFEEVVSPMLKEVSIFY